MRNARACDDTGIKSTRHCPKGHILTFTHHVTISASITDRSMTPAYQACPLRLEPRPPMTEGVQLVIRFGATETFVLD